MTSTPPEKNSEPSPPGSGLHRPKIHLNFRQLRAAAVGWNFITAPLAGGAVGYGIDWLLGIFPWVMAIGILLGFVSAFIELMRSAR